MPQQNANCSGKKKDAVHVSHTEKQSAAGEQPTRIIKGPGLGRHGFPTENASTHEIRNALEAAYRAGRRELNDE